MSRSSLGSFALSLVAAAALAASAVAASAPTKVQASGAADLKMDPTFLNWDNTFRFGAGYHASRLEFSAARPAWIKREPAYRTTPRYAVVTLGNGPRSKHAIAVDEPKSGDARVYFDLDGSGDLVKGQTGVWEKRRRASGLTTYTGTAVLRASYGTPKHETSSALYGLNFYRDPIRDAAFYFRAAVRQGYVKLGGVQRSVVLSEDANDGMFVKPMDPYNPSYRGVWLRFDDGSEFDVRGTFVYQGKNYQAVVSDDGSSIAIRPTSKVVRVPVPTITASLNRPLLPVGDDAPDFTAIRPDGSLVKLSDLRGKIVVLDFWATWCGPCQQSLPHLEKVYMESKDHNVVVLAINVWDDKPAYEAWIPAHKQYSFDLALDPAGRKTKDSIATKLYKVSGIPTTYVVSPEGKIAADFVGFEVGEHRLEDAIKKLNEIASIGNSSHR